MEEILLDYFGDAILPENYRLIDTEIQFLEFALVAEGKLIKGDWLCDWAKEFYNGRNIPFENANSFVRDLNNQFPSIGIEQAKEIQILLQNNGVPNVKLKPREILKGCVPNYIWEETPSKEHAARWLLWLDEAEIPQVILPLMKIICDEWEKEKPQFAEIYLSMDADSARKLIEKWICFSDAHFSVQMGSFPIQLPRKWENVKLNYWRKEITLTYGKYFLEYFEYSSNNIDKTIVIDETVKYFSRYRDALDDMIISKLRNYASTSQLSKLNKLKPVPKPGPIPEEPDLVLRWFEREYLPHRQQCVDQEDRIAYADSLQAAKEFVQWYLKFYPQAIVNGKHLSPHKVRQHYETDKDHVDLLIILDGLNAKDANTLRIEFAKNSDMQNWSIVENTFVFSPLPTVTEFTKKHLLRGSLSAKSDSIENIGIDIGDKGSPGEILSNSKPGDLVIWKIQEPDLTYHKDGQSKDLATRLEGQLALVSRRIANGIKDIPDGIPIRIIITSDHGRMIGTSPRDIEVPEGFVAHGRAASGKSNMNFDRDGFRIEENLIYLSPVTFQLESDVVAMVFDDHAFVHERYKEEVSPHGGVFPEEVLVPWIVYIREPEKPMISFEISGSNQANKEGIAKIIVINSSVYSCNLEKIELNFGAKIENQILDDLIKPLSTFEKKIIISSWPSADQIQAGSGRVTFNLPNGEIFHMAVDLKYIDSSSMYSRDNILEDLI